ncbi:LysR family transcriptional regulator [Sinorhizobium fredii]|uniref:LysR family transcriptional regulator n=1 Tax=Rhizobium fredii TaxID=380 RepID=UPI0004B4C444|nr:LysR family transcriptional regulator [Sinorhizobium fredii]
MDWNDLKFFLAVANAGSLTAASSQLGVSPSTVSRRIEALEAGLKVKLFRPHRDGYNLTPAGRELLPSAEAEAQMRVFERTAREKGGNHLTGPVRLDVPELLGQEVLLPGLAGFLQSHPDIRIEMHSSVHPLRLVTEQTDIVLRLVRPERGNYRQRKLGHVAFGIYAAPGYAARQGTPASPADLYRHRVIGWTEDLRYLVMANWLEALCPGLQPALRLSSLGAQMAAVKHGLGLAELPSFAAEPAGLVSLLPEAPRLIPELWMLVHEQAAALPRVRHVKDALTTVLSPFKHVLPATDRRLRRPASPAPFAGLDMRLASAIGAAHGMTLRSSIAEFRYNSKLTIEIDYIFWLHSSRKILGGSYDEIHCFCAWHGRVHRYLGLGGQRGNLQDRPIERLGR